MAAFPVAAGNPQYSGNYIPQIWEPRIQTRFYKTLVAQDISNTDYENSIKGYGDTVHIRRYPDITVSTYRKGETLKKQTPDISKISLVIDQGQYFHLAVDDVDAVQSDVNLIEEFTKTAGEQLKEKVDEVVLQGFYSDADSNNYGSTAGADSSGYDLGTTSSPLSLTKANILDAIVDINSCLDEQNTPDDGQRWLVLPPILVGLISKSDLKDASMTGDKESILRNGKIGMIDNMKIYKSRNLLTGGSTYWYCVFGHPKGLTFAAQLEKTRSFPDPDTFGQIVDGIMVFGYKGVDATAIGYMIAQKG